MSKRINFLTFEMLALFINSIRCESSKITMKEADTLFTQTPHKPIFVSLESIWCPHCYEFKPIRERLEQHYKGNKLVDMRTISCDKEKELCKAFPGEGTPRIYMVTTTIEEAERYDGSRTYEELNKFIKKFIEPTILQVENEDQLKTQLKNNLQTSIFLLQDLQNTEYSKIFSELANKYINYPAQFINLTYRRYDTISPQIVNYFSPTDKSLHFNGSLHELDYFVRNHLYPPFGAPSSLFFSMQKELRQPFLVYHDWRKTRTNDFIALTAKFPDNLKSIDIDCMNYDKFCKAIAVDPAKVPFITIVNTLRNTYFHYPDKFNETTLVPWTHDVMNGKIKEQGPGAGLIGWYRRNIQPTVMNYKVWFIVIGCTIPFVIVVIILKCCFVDNFKEKED